MSARHRKYRPDPHGRCYTPQALADAIVDHVNPREPYLNVLEPSAGEGAFVRSLATRLTESLILAVEPHRTSKLESALEENPGRCCISLANMPLELFFGSRHSRDTHHFNLTIGNPPYELARSHVELLLPQTEALAFLLRLNWLGGRKRSQWLTTTPLAEVLTVVPRPGFGRVVVDESGSEVRLEGGSDATEYAVFIWRRGHVGAPKLGWLNWK